MEGLSCRQPTAKACASGSASPAGRSVAFHDLVYLKSGAVHGSNTLAIGCALLVIVLLSALRSTAQTTASQTQTRQDQETLRVLTEEVRVPIIAYNEHENADPTLEADDILLLEDGMPQQIRSVRRVPADVLLLLDTGGDVNPAKDLKTTRAVAARLIARLRADDRVAIMQVNERVEILQHWTTDKQTAARAVMERLFSGRRSRLAQALQVAAEYLATSSSLNRHLVLFTDGAETSPEPISREALARKLVQTGATMHFLDYSELGREEIARREAIVRPRERSRVPEEVLRELPQQARPIYRTPGGITIDLDRQKRQRIEEYKKAMRDGAAQLRALAAETGGIARSPASTEEMLARAEEVARDIAAQYIITYAPRRPLVSASEGERRRIEVAPRRAGLQLKARRAYVYVERKPG